MTNDEVDQLARDMPEFICDDTMTQTCTALAARVVELLGLTSKLQAERLAVVHASRGRPFPADNATAAAVGKMADRIEDREERVAQHMVQISILERKHRAMNTHCSELRERADKAEAKVAELEAELRTYDKLLEGPVLDEVRRRGSKPKDTPK